MGTHFQKIAFCVLVLVRVSDGAGTFDNSPSVSSINENHDSELTIWSIRATCQIETTCSSRECDSYTSWYWSGWGLKTRTSCRYFTSYYQCSKLKECSHCDINSDTSSSKILFMDGKTVKKRACATPGCGPVCTGNHCLNHPQSWKFKVACWKTGYQADGRMVSNEYTLSTTDNSAPSAWLEVSTPTPVSHSSHPINTYVNGISYRDADGDSVTYSIADDSKFIPWDYPGNSRDSERLFRFNTGNGNIYVNQDLSNEYSYEFTGIEICVFDRRHTVCVTLAIRLTQCFDIPRCQDVEGSVFADTHPIGGTLYDMEPKIIQHHFPSFSNTWQGLQWSLDSSNLDVAFIEPDTGILKTSGNITVYPYRSHIFSATIRIGNSDSCSRTTTCSATFTGTFTNYPIEIRSLDASGEVHENFNDAYIVHKIITYDNNYADQDIVTCEMEFTPYEENLFTLENNGNNFDSWYIYRHRCLYPTCEFECPEDSGCFTYSRHPQYRFEVTCRDAYDTSASGVFTLNIIDNTPPFFTGMNTYDVAINKDDYSVGSSVLQIYAVNLDSAEDGDQIQYSVKDDTKYIPWDYDGIPRNTERLFSLDTATGLLTVAMDLSMEYSRTYTDIVMCLRDRRDDDICASWTITLHACFQIPLCQNQSYHNFEDTHPVGDTLFEMQYPDPSFHFDAFSPVWQELTWTMDETDLSEADVGYMFNTGILRPSMNITVWPSWPYREYYAIIRVHNSESCDRSTTCRLDFTIYFKNWPIEIRSLDASGEVHENFNDPYTVHQIITYDENYAYQDTVTCEMDFTPYEDNLFTLKNNGNNFDSWYIYREGCLYPTCEFDCPENSGCFTYSRHPQYQFEVTCRDAYGTAASGVFTLIIIDNTPPFFTGLNTYEVVINKDDYPVGSSVLQIHAVNLDSAEDGDHIRYSVKDDTKYIPWDYDGISRNTERLFSLDTATGLLTVAMDLSMEYSRTYTDIVMCIRDRRDDDICNTWTITLHACFQIPLCQNQTYHNFEDTHPVGDTLFEMQYPEPSLHFDAFSTVWQGLTWTMDDTDLSEADVDYMFSTGILRASMNITVWPSWPYREYYAIVRVHNSESCARSTTCRLDFSIYFKNWPIEIRSLPFTIYVHENNDTSFIAHSIVAYDNNNRAHDNVTCSMSFRPYEPGMFTLEHDGRYEYNSWNIQRTGCLDLGCRFNCAKGRGCFTYDTTDSHTFEFDVACWDAYDSNVTEKFYLVLEENEKPVFTSGTPTYVYINKDTHNNGDYVTRLITENTDAWVDNDFIRYSVTNDSQFIPWDYENISRVNDRLFQLDEATGYVYVNQDLSMEYSFVFRDIEFCIADRRDYDICMTVTINLTACYEIPTCHDQSYMDFWDSHPVDAQLFKMMYPDPKYHFPVDFRPDLQRLTWTMGPGDTDLAEAALDSDTGILSPYMNITVWPSWRYRDYYAIITAHNEESCQRTTTCRMDFRIWFTNHDIRFINLPAVIVLNEDNDDEIQSMIDILTYDHNFHLHDNVTCYMNFTPYEDNLFVLEHDGRNDYDSFWIHRLPCQDPECGFHCAKHRGCFTHNLTQEYVLNVTCYDAYDSWVTDFFTVTIDYNRAPRFLNLPHEMTVKADFISEFDLFFSIQYSDYENEHLYYNYSYAPDGGIYNGKLIFKCDPDGSYYGSLANISSTMYYHNMEGSTYYIYICGTERRNMICDTLTIHILDECSESPTCTDDTLTIWDTTPVDTLLFTIQGQQDPSSIGSPSYSFTSPTPSYFKIDQFWGNITVATPLVANYPSTTYQLTGFVYDSSACNYGSCQFTVTSLFTNHPIIITGQPYCYENLLEDTEDATILAEIETLDNNTADTVECTKTQVTSLQTADPISQDIFRIRKTYPGSMVFLIETRENPGFTSAITEYQIDFACNDKYGSTASATLTVTINPNDTPVINNLDDSIRVDQSKTGQGDTIFRVSTSDTENDPLTFTSSVDNPFVPLSISEVGVVYMNRDVSVIDEDEAVFSISICVHDPTHTLQAAVCGTLTVTFISSQKYPELDNLPATVERPEEEGTPGGTELYVLNVTDENLDSVHIYSMTKVDPADASTMFSLDSRTGILLLQPAARFNFEDRTTYILTFAVKDQYLTGLERKDLTIKVINVNESPTIHLLQESISFDEDTGPGAVLVDILATCSDIDYVDTHSYSIENTNYSSYLSINTTTSKLSLAQEWDLESTMPTESSMNIICTDAGGNTSIQSISVTVRPINEFTPIIIPTSMAVSVTSETEVTEILDKITSVSDADYGDDGSFVYDIVGIPDVSYGKKYFTVTDNGELRVRKPIELNYDIDFEFTISVSDNDNTPQEKIAYCKVTATYTAPGEKMPEKPTYCTTCTTEGKLIVGALVIEGAILVGIIASIARHVYLVKTATSAATTGLSNTTNATLTQPRPNASLNNASLNNNQRPIQQQQQQQQRQQEDRQQDDDEDEESTSEDDDSDIDERLRRVRNEPMRQVFQSRNAPLASSVYASSIPGTAFGAGNYV